MLKLEADKMQKAIERAKNVHPKVRVVNAAERTYAVSGSKGGEYLVKFVVANGHRLAECTCPARTLCYHIASAAAVNIGVRGGYSRDSKPADNLSIGQMQMYVARNTGWCL